MPSSDEDIELCLVDRLSSIEPNGSPSQNRISSIDSSVRFEISFNFDSFTISRMKLIKSHYNNRKNKNKLKGKIYLQINFISIIDKIT
jgi:hypothetical protein